MGSFFLTMILILAIAIVFDISEKIDDFQNGATMNEIVFDYYINFIAFYGNLAKRVDCENINSSV